VEIQRAYKVGIDPNNVSLSESLRQIRYKASWAGVSVVEADRFYRCGKVKSDLTLSDRVYKCAACGFTLDRDMNAAINLAKLAPSSGVTACGEVLSPLKKFSLKATSLKQEPNTSATK
jgi:transposase